LASNGLYTAQKRAPKENLFFIVWFSLAAPLLAVERKIRKMAKYLKAHFSYLPFFLYCLSAQRKVKNIETQLFFKRRKDSKERK